MLKIRPPETGVVPAIALALLIYIVHSAVLGASEVGDGISKLFELGVKNTPPALTAAKSQYEQLKRVNLKDWRIDYAYGIVLVNQHKYHDALPLFSRYLETGRRELNAYRMKIWAQLQDRQFADSLDAMVSLSKQFPRDPNVQVDAEFAETARFMGTMFGYLELARPGVVDLKLKAKCRNAVLAQLEDRYTPSFDEGRNSVAGRLAELQAERKTTAEHLAAVADQRQKKDKAALEDVRGKIAVEQEAMQSSAEQLSEAERELGVIGNQLVSLRTDRTRLGAQIIVIQTQIAELTTNGVSTVDQTTPGSRFPVVRTETSVTSIPLDRVVQARALSMSLTTLNKQAFNMDRNILALQGRAAVLMGKGEQEAQSLEQRDAAVQRAAKHAKVVEKKLRREEASPPKASTAALTSQMTSLSTYLPFPYEQEKKRVLGWFEKK